MTSLAVRRLRDEARELQWLGDRLLNEAEALFEAAGRHKAEARKLEERAQELEDEQHVSRLAGAPAKISKGRRVA